VEPEATLVGTKSGVELDTVSTVDLDLAFIIFPDNTELDDTLRNGDDLKSLAELRLLLEKSGVLESGGELCFGIVSLVTPKLCPWWSQAEKMPMGNGLSRDMNCVELE
jgi:hypothetical protein